MRFPLAYYLLLLYSTVMLKPLIPVIEDNIEHCFAEAYHIATIHMKYGNNHLENELASTNSDGSTNKDQNTTKSEETMPVHVFVSAYLYHYLSSAILPKKFAILTLHKIPFIFIAKHIQPPKNIYLNK